MIVKGSSFTMWYGTDEQTTSLIGAASAHDMQLSSDLTEVADAASDTAARSYIAGRTGWSAHVTRLLVAQPLSTDTAIPVQADQLIEGSIVNVCLSIGTDYYRGQAVIESLTLNAPLRDTTTADVTFRGVGPLTIIDKGGEEPYLIVSPESHQFLSRSRRVGDQHVISNIVWTVV